MNCNTGLKKIKAGNDFSVKYTFQVRDCDRPYPLQVDFREVENLDVKFILDTTTVSVSPVIEKVSSRSLLIRACSKDFIRNGLYRLSVSFTYMGNHFTRNPKAFQLMGNVEDEGICCCEDVVECLDFVEMSYNLLYGSTGYTSNLNRDGISDKPSWLRLFAFKLPPVKDIYQFTCSLMVSGKRLDDEGEEESVYTAIRYGRSHSQARRGQL
ncbi:hypothetical protein Barb6XT_00105 [Bacteroidales bacterium Barb6XT]|nr:hypothetical protein Barb6XT_00105 [Bacteroidales bacterium Barb6XT]